MTSVKKLTMAPTVMANQHISVQKSFFGLFSKAVYTPTDSPVTASRHEYAVEQAPFFRKLLTASSDQLSKLADGADKPKEAPLGNIMIEVCQSADSQFVAFQMLQFTNFTYEPVAPARVLEGADAEKVAKLFRE